MAEKIKLFHLDAHCGIEPGLPEIRQTFYIESSSPVAQLCFQVPATPITQQDPLLSFRGLVISTSTVIVS